MIRGTSRPALLALGLVLFGCSERADVASRAPGTDSPAAEAPRPGIAPAVAESPAPGIPATSPDASRAGPGAVREPVTAAAAASKANGAGPRPFREDIPLAPMGTPLRKSFLDGREDPNRVADPERESVLVGRRMVARRDDIEFSDSFPSADALARAILEGTFYDDPALLDALRITRAEFADLFWPEFPQSRPATGMQAGDAWSFHDAACRDGMTAILSEWGGTELHYVRVRFDVGFAPYTNFHLYKGAVIEAVDDRGEPVEIRAAAVFAERNGLWKIYMYDA